EGVASRASRSRQPVDFSASRSSLSRNALRRASALFRGGFVRTEWNRRIGKQIGIEKRRKEQFMRSGKPRAAHFLFASLLALFVPGGGPALAQSFRFSTENDL